MNREKLTKLINNAEKNPHSPLARYALANEYFKLKMFTETIEELKKYLDIHDDEGAAYRMLAYSYEELGQREMTIQSLNDGIKAAVKNGHDSMAQEFREEIERLED